jgi:outer membrane protein assembly factor BamD (BamD/ComL family)
MSTSVMKIATWSLGLALMMTACGGGDKDGIAKSTDMAERIRVMEDSIFQNMTFDKRNAQALLDVYKAYAATHPLDTLAPEYLFRAAGVAKNMRDPEQSLFLYDRIIRDYPSWRRLPDTYYLKAFTLDSDMDRKGEAQEAYKEVIKRYPDHPFARDAKVMIENLQYTDEELIEMFRMRELMEQSGEPM